MNRTVKIIAAIVIVLAIPAVIQKVMFGSKSDPGKVLTKLADETNAGLPRKIDAVTTLTRVEYDQKVWRIHYAMDRGAAIDPGQIDKYRSFAAKQICAGEMKTMLENKITIEYLYTYTDSGGEQKLKVSIPPGSCS